MSVLTFVAAPLSGHLTSTGSRRAAARPGTRRGMDEPRPAAEGQVVSQKGLLQ